MIYGEYGTDIFWDVFNIYLHQFTRPLDGNLVRLHKYLTSVGETQDTGTSQLDSGHGESIEWHQSIQTSHRGPDINTDKPLDEILLIWQGAYWQLRVGGTTLSFCQVGSAFHFRHPFFVPRDFT